MLTSRDTNCKKAECTSQSPRVPAVFLTIPCGFNQLAKQHLSQHLQPAAGISSRKCEQGDADRTQIPRGSQGFRQVRCSKGSLEHSCFSLCSCISSEQGWAPRWIGGGMSLWVDAWHLSDAAQGRKRQSRRLSWGNPVMPAFSEEL